VLGIPVQITSDPKMGARCQPGPDSNITLEAAWHSDEESLPIHLPFDFLWGDSNYGWSGGGGIWVRASRSALIPVQACFCRAVPSGKRRSHAVQSPVHPGPKPVLLNTLAAGQHQQLHNAGRKK
jgi:hypothetical protein